MIRVGIAGAAGYTAGELIRVLISHRKWNYVIYKVNRTGENLSDEFIGI